MCAWCMCTQYSVAQRPEPMLHTQGAVQRTRGCWWAESDEGMRIPSKALVPNTAALSLLRARGIAENQLLADSNTFRDPDSTSTRHLCPRCTGMWA